MSDKRINELYNIGLKLIAKKREGDKDKNIIDLEKNKEFCTFKPNLEHSGLDLNNTNSFYNEKANALLCERLAKGKYVINNTKIILNNI